MGVFLAQDRTTFEDAMQGQIAKARAKRGQGDLQKLLDGEESWTIS
jgi:hypothetical protein